MVENNDFESDKLKSLQNGLFSSEYAAFNSLGPIKLYPDAFPTLRFLRTLTSGSVSEN